MAGDVALTAQEEWQELPRRNLRVAAVKSLAVAVPAVAVLVRLLARLEWTPGAIAAASGAAAVLVVAAVLVYETARLRAFRWRLTDDRLEVRSGIAVRQHRSIPRDRIRSVDLRADPVRRLSGLTLVKVGTGEHADVQGDLTLDALTRDRAEELRALLLPREERPHDAPIAAFDWRWARFAPLSVWSFAGGALLLGTLYKVLDVLGVKVLAEDGAAALWRWVTGEPWVAVPLLVTVNAAVGVAGALLLFAESWGRYRLEREPGRLRLHRGLLTHRSLTLQERRLRGVEISEPLLLRLGGGARVKAVATGLGAKGDDETEDVAALTPPLPRPQAAQVAAEVAGAVLPEPLPHPPAARRRRFVSALVTLPVSAGLAIAVSWGAVRLGWLPVSWWAGPFWQMLGAVMVVRVPVVLWMAADGYRALGHALGPRHLVSRQGTAIRRTVALDRDGIVGWTITQSFFQRRSGLLTVSATTAAGAGHYDIVDAARGEILELAARAVPGLLDPFLVRSPTPDGHRDERGEDGGLARDHEEDRRRGQGE